VFVQGLTFGLHHRVVRPVMFASLVGMSFMIFGFYSWQRYFLDLLGRELVWVSGLVAALLSLSMIAGNALVQPASRVVRTRTGILAGAVVVEMIAVIVAGASGFLFPHPIGFFVALGSYLVYGVALGVGGPVKQGYLNAHIPSAQRATIISLDSLFADMGGVVGQSGWGYLAKMRSIGEAWLYSGATLILAVPLYWIARQNDKSLDSFQAERQSPSGKDA
jgi:MFS family permease